jgi:hypothetical protein
MNTLFVPLVLVCLAGQDPRECTPFTAADVIEAEPANNEMMCGFYGQAALAGTAIGRDLRGGYFKVLCERRRVPRTD